MRICSALVNSRDSWKNTINKWLDSYFVKSEIWKQADEFVWLSVIKMAQF